MSAEGNTEATETFLAAHVELGDLLVIEGERHRVVGWFFDARGRTVIEYAGRRRTFSSFARLERVKNARKLSEIPLTVSECSDTLGA